jgi:hypothetical protein
MMALCYDRPAFSISHSRPEVADLTLPGDLDGKHPIDAMFDVALGGLLVRHGRSQAAAQGVVH